MTQEYENGTENDGSQIVLILISDSQMYCLIATYSTIYFTRGV